MRPLYLLLSTCSLFFKFCLSTNVLYLDSKSLELQLEHAPNSVAKPKTSWRTCVNELVGSLLLTLLSSPPRPLCPYSNILLAAFEETTQDLEFARRLASKWKWRRRKKRGIRGRGNRTHEDPARARRTPREVR